MKPGTPEYHRFHGKKRREKLYAPTRALIEAAKDRPCMDCGGRFDPICMDFDHRPGEVKKYNLSTTKGRVSLETVRREIAKCDVVCSNCHRLRTKKRGTWDRRPPSPKRHVVSPQLNLITTERK